MPSSSTLPPYLTSGASSRAHHAFLVKLSETSSPQQEDDIITETILAAKSAVAARGCSVSKISETLIILLHCAMLRHSTDISLDFALRPALQLAGGGADISQRQLGYLYLAEQLPPDHELNLMLVNTIRKDLSSSTTSHVLLALHTIVQLPSRDLGPSVTPLLISKPLTRNRIAAIRQKVYEALLSLHWSDEFEPQPFVLSMGKLVKALEHEDDRSVLSVIVRTIRKVAELHGLENVAEKEYILQSVLDKVYSPDCTTGPLILEALQLFRVLVKGDQVVSLTPMERLANWLQDQIIRTNTFERWHAALFIEICSLVHSVPSIASSCLSSVSRILHPPWPSSPELTLRLPTPNDHVLALRCLMALPVSAWDGKLEESDMSIIMEGVNSADDSVRKITIQLLNSLSVELPNMILNGYIDSLRSSSNLSLPLVVPPSLSIESKILMARRETADRALEVLAIVARKVARSFGEGVVAVLLALEDGREDGIWEEGLSLILSRVDHSPVKFQEQITIYFLDSLPPFSSNIGSSCQTLITIAAAVSLQYPPPSITERCRAILSLLNIIHKTTAAQQEVILVALVSLSSPLAMENIRQQVVGEVMKLQDVSPKYLKKRCMEVVLVFENNLFSEVFGRLKSLSLPNVLASINETVRLYKEEAASSVTPDVRHSLSRASESTLDVTLRYDPYDAPKN